MRPSRMLILGFAGLTALHVYMLAGHGRSHDAAMAAPVMGEHPSAPSVPSLAPATPGDHDTAGIDMTVACLAVLAGLLLLLPGRRGQPATAGPHRPAAIRPLARPERLDPQTRSLAELCISLT
jgi:hypothetical protein